MKFKTVLIFCLLLNVLSTLAQSPPENGIASALKINSKKKCIIYKDSSGFRIPYYELNFDEEGLNTSRIMGVDIDEYAYDQNNELIDWSFCLNGDSLWCLKNKYLYNEQGLLRKALYRKMPATDNRTDSTIYVYQDTLLTEKIFYKNGSLSYKTVITTELTEKGKTVTESSFKKDKLFKVATYSYNVRGEMIFRRFDYQHNRPMFTTYFKYDDLGRETTYMSYSGQNDAFKDTTQKFYQNNGLIDRVETPGFTLYYEYE